MTTSCSSSLFEGRYIGLLVAAVLVSVALSATYLVQDAHHNRVFSLSSNISGEVSGPAGIEGRSTAEIPDGGLETSLSRAGGDSLRMKMMEDLEDQLSSQGQLKPTAVEAAEVDSDRTSNRNSNESTTSDMGPPDQTTTSTELMQRSFNRTSQSALISSEDLDIDSPYDGCSAVRNAPREKQCSLSKVKCKTLSGDSILDYMSLHYCHFGGNPLISVPLYTVCLLLAFYLLADTAENFFCPTVTTLSDMLNLSPNTAGVTLLALGNGAPDLLGSLASFNNGDPHIIVGAILSAGTFVTSFVVGSVALFVAPFPVEGPAFMRNAAMYGMGVLLVLVIYSGRVLHFWQALGLVLYYFFFVGLVIFFDRREHPAQPAHHEQKDDHLPEHSRLHAHRHRHHSGNSGAATHHPVVRFDVDVEDCEGKQGDATGEDSQHRRLSESDDADSASSKKSSLLETLLTPCERCRSGTLLEHPGAASVPHSQSIVCHESSVGRGLNSASNVFNVVKRPIHFVFDPIRWATVPTGQHPQDHDTYYTIANVLFCPAVFLWGLDSTFNMSLEAPLPFLPLLPMWLPFYFVAVLLGTASWTYSHASVPPLWVVIASFSLSITWVGIFARELLGILSSLGAVLGASDALLGVTILAWGNSIGDLVTNVTMAMSGQPMMAVSGCFAGPLFNLMLGLGIPLTVKTFWLSPEPWHFQEDPHISLIFPFLLTSVVGSLCAVHYSGYKVTRAWGIFLILWYVLFVFASVLVCIVSET